jgi:protein tyrosine phosphatase (PTP) superfamily phosphohydrolase (DUF442 family)
MKKWTLIVLTALVLFAVIIVYQLLFTERIDTVVEGSIYRSSQLSPSSLQRMIRDKGIRTVINLRGSPRDSEWYLKEREITEKNNVLLYDIMLSPRDLPDYSTLQSILEMLSRSEKPILIHCRRGSDRTGMVSALALVFEQDPPLSDVLKQFSWRYGVFPFYRSIGPYLFSRYGLWLEETHQRHTRDNLLFWLRNEYLDGQGNIRYWIDKIGDEKVQERKTKVVIGGSPGSIVIEGWAFDSRTKGPARGLSIVVDGWASSPVDFRYDRPDVARYFGFGGGYSEHFPVGWRAEFSTQRVGKGCHNISFRLVNKGSEVLEIPAAYEFCS